MTPPTATPVRERERERGERLRVNDQVPDNRSYLNSSHRETGCFAAPGMPLPSSWESPHYSICQLFYDGPPDSEILGVIFDTRRMAISRGRDVPHYCTNQSGQSNSGPLLIIKWRNRVWLLSGASSVAAESAVATGLRSDQSDSRHLLALSFILIQIPERFRRCLIVCEIRMTLTLLRFTGYSEKHL